MTDEEFAAILALDYEPSGIEFKLSPTKISVSPRIIIDIDYHENRTIMNLLAMIWP